MARHRNVRSMNYDEEYEGYYDIYGHSVEDDFCVSPSTAAEFLYDRNAKAHSMSAYLAPTGESLPEEPENEERVARESSVGPVRPPDTGGGHDRFDQGELRECLETMQNVVGETIPEATLLRAAVEHGLNAERALSAVLDATDDPKPQRVRRDRQKNAEGIKEEPPDPSAEAGGERTWTACTFEETPDKGKAQPSRLAPKAKPTPELPGTEISETANQNVAADDGTSAGEDESAPDVLVTPRSGKSRAADIDPLAEYDRERGKGKVLVNLVVIGHVDAGKSTLMGHLLYKLGHVGKKVMHRYEQDSKKLGKASFMYAWVLDETNEERNRGITMDVAQSKFETENRSVTLLDAPGHKDFIPNMIAGAARADVAILVVDATRGEFETGFDAGGQTREHTLLARSLGVSQLAVAVNKMDNVSWDQGRYSEIVHKLRSFMKQAGIKESDVTFVPCSGLTGENLTGRAVVPALACWYNGPCLVDVIDGFKPPERAVSKPFRMCVGDVFKSTGSGLCVSGRIEAGHLRNGQRLSVMPAGETVVVKGIVAEDGPVGHAFAGDHVTLSLSGTDGNNLTAGSILCDPTRPVRAATRFRARVVVFNVEVPVTKGFPVVLHYQSLSEQATVRKLVSQLHKSTGEVVKRRPRCLLKNSSGVVELEVSRPICVELYRDYRDLGRFMLRSGGSTVAAGLVTEIL